MNTLSDHGNQQLDTVDRLAYEMSQQSYVAPDKRKQYVQNYQYDPELSNTDTAIYHNHATKMPRSPSVQKATGRDSSV